MSDNNRAKDEFSELDFGSFEPEPPSGGHEAHAAPPPAHDDLAGFDDADFGMPDPGGHSAHRAKPASPESDFADLGGFDGFEGGEPEEHHVPVHAEPEPEDDFGQALAPVGRPAPAARPAARQSARAPVAGFDDEPEEDHGHDDATHDGEGHDHDPDAELGEEEDEPGEAGKSRMGALAGKLDVSKLIMPVGGGIAALFVGLMGYTYFLAPMMGSSEAVTPTGPLTTVSERVQPAPSTRQAMGGGVSLDSAPVPTQRQPFPPDAAQRPSPMPPAPSAMPVTASGPAPFPVPAQQPQPTTTRLPDASGPTMAAAALSKADAPLPGRADPAVDERIRQLQARIDVLERQGSTEMQARMRQLEERVAQAETRSVPAAPRPETAVPYKPQVIDGWTLQGVNRDVAWVQGPNGLREVREGDDLGSAGKVMGIQRYKKDFIVVTSVGVIMRS